MAISYDQYIINLQGDFVDFIASESTAFRGIGTRSRSARVRLNKLLFLNGAYRAVLEYSTISETNMFSIAQMTLFQDIINDIMGTSYDVAWLGGTWYDSDNGGIWDDSLNGGIWDDND